MMFKPMIAAAAVALMIFTPANGSELEKPTCAELVDPWHDFAQQFGKAVKVMHDQQRALDGAHRYLNGEAAKAAEKLRRALFNIRPELIEVRDAYRAYATALQRCAWE